jgi:hypothetical protein
MNELHKCSYCEKNCEHAGLEVNTVCPNNSASREIEKPFDLSIFRIEKRVTNFVTTGIVIGFLWCGSKGCYTIGRSMSYSTKKALLEAETERLNSGSFGDFESTIAALLIVQKKEILTVNGLDYVNTDYEDVFIGDPKEEDFQELIAHRFLGE